MPAHVQSTALDSEQAVRPLRGKSESISHAPSTVASTSPKHYVTHGHAASSNGHLPTVPADKSPTPPQASPAAVEHDNDAGPVGSANTQGEGTSPCTSKHGPGIDAFGPRHIHAYDLGNFPLGIYAQPSSCFQPIPEDATASGRPSSTLTPCDQGCAQQEQLTAPAALGVGLSFPDGCQAQAGHDGACDAADQNLLQNAVPCEIVAAENATSPTAPSVNGGGWSVPFNPDLASAIELYRAAMRQRSITIQHSHCLPSGKECCLNPASPGQAEVRPNISKPSAERTSPESPEIMPGAPPGLLHNRESSDSSFPLAHLRQVTQPLLPKPTASAVPAMPAEPWGTQADGRHGTNPNMESCDPVHAWSSRDAAQLDQRTGPRCLEQLRGVDDLADTLDTLVDANMLLDPPVAPSVRSTSSHASPWLSFTNPIAQANGEV